MLKAKAVLGLFADEAELRDHIAANISELELGLEVLAVEHRIESKAGAGGRVDIFARDKFDHTVCIEIKRSDVSARQTLNELSKYVALFIEQYRLPRESIRCIVVSTHWHNLEKELSYFASTAGVSVRAVDARAESGRLILETKRLKQWKFEPQLSPEITLFEYESASDRNSHIEHIRERVALIPFVRIAIVLLDPSIGVLKNHRIFRAILCIWQISPEHHALLEEVIQEPVGFLEPYPFPGWEAECDATYWVSESGNPPGIIPTWAEHRRGTPEKISLLLNLHSVNTIERIGDWPDVDFVNSDTLLLEQFKAQSVRSGSGQPNTHNFYAVISPAAPASWRSEIEQFLQFIAFEPYWERAARDYLSGIEDPEFSVELRGFRKKNVFYGIYQAISHSNATLSCFTVSVRRAGEDVGHLVGHYTWDGITRPRNAAANVETVYGSSVFAVASLFSARDEFWDKACLPMHGFIPILKLFVNGEWSSVDHPYELRSLRDFVVKNREYCDELAAVLNSHGPLLADPTGLEPID